MKAVSKSNELVFLGRKIELHTLNSSGISHFYRPPDFLIFPKFLRSNWGLPYLEELIYCYGSLAVLQIIFFTVNKRIIHLLANNSVPVLKFGRGSLVVDSHLTINLTTIE